MMLSSSSSSPSLKPYPPHSPLRGGGFSLVKMVAPASPSTHIPSPKFNLPFLDTTTVPSSVSLSYAVASASCNFSSPPPPTSNSFSVIKNPIHHQNPPPPPSSSSTPAAAAAADVQKSNKKFVFRIRTTAYKAAKPNPNPNPKNITDDHHPPKSKVMSNGAGPAVEGDTIKKLLLLQQGTNDTAPPSGHDDDDDDNKGFVPYDRVGVPADHCLHHHQAMAKPRLIQTKKGNHSKKRKLTLLLTDEEIEEDILFMTGEKPARIPKPNNKRAMEDHNEQKDDPQHNMDTVFPGLRLGSITTKSYRVRP